MPMVRSDQPSSPLHNNATGNPTFCLGVLELSELICLGIRLYLAENSTFFPLRISIVKLVEAA